MSQPTITPKRGRPPGSTSAELLAVARELFVERGFRGTTMDLVAARGRVSKQSLYAAYGSKDELYTAVVRDWVDRGYDVMRPHSEALAQAEDVRAGLLRHATVMQAGILTPQVLAIRNLVAAEADRFPTVAADYVARSWDRNTRMLARALIRLSERGLLELVDADLAAEQLVWLVIGSPLNRLSLQGGARRPASRRLQAVAEQAVDTFLSRYGRLGADRPH